MTRMMTLLAGAALGMTLAGPSVAQTTLRQGPACQNQNNPDDIVNRDRGDGCPAGYIRVRLVPAGSAAAGAGAAAGGAAAGGAAGAAGAVGGFGAAAAAGLAVAVVGVAVGGSSSGSH